VDPFTAPRPKDVSARCCSATKEIPEFLLQVERKWLQCLQEDVGRNILRNGTLKIDFFTTTIFLLSLLCFCRIFWPEAAFL
jgi:hypothetical protein